MQPETVDVDIPKAAYSNGWEHICDELKRLDLRIHLQMLKSRGDVSGTPPADWGMVPSEVALDRLLGKASPAFDETLEPGLRPLMSQLADLAAHIDGMRSVSEAQNLFLPLAHLSRTFSLSAFEEQCLIICLAPELERKYQKLFGYLHDDLSLKQPSIGLLLDLLCDCAEEKVAARRVFHKGAPLFRFSLLHNLDPVQEPFISRGLKLDDRITGFLLGHNELDAKLTNSVRRRPPDQRRPREAACSEIDARVERLIKNCLAQPEPANEGLIFYLRGPAGAGQEVLAEETCQRLGVDLLWVDLERMQEGGEPFEELVRLLGREATLRSAALALAGFDNLVATGAPADRLESLLEMLESYSRLTFIFAQSQWSPRGALANELFIDLEFSVPGEDERKKTWERRLQSEPRFEELDHGHLASQFRFTKRQIEEALRSARQLALWRSPENPTLTREDLYAACRNRSYNELGSLAGRLDHRYGWGDLILPADQVSRLREICVQARHREIVYGEWGFGPRLSGGKGLNVLFAGPPGTGKTMAAEVLAGELGLDLFRIDLSLVVSKYIGETEKNLARVFTAAEASNAILFFDEADALFGKRSEVKDAHDRYANIEIGYLLQKLEEYEGIVVLATNLGKNIDPAFQRRMHFVVEFPFPDEELRERIWSSVFPREAPVDRGLDFAALAARFRFAGGNIRNIALYAAFRAAERGGEIGIGEIVEGVRREYQKLGGNPGHETLLADLVGTKP